MNLYNHLLDVEKYAGKWAVLKDKSTVMVDTQTEAWQYRRLDPPVRVRLRYTKIKEGTLTERIMVHKVHMIAQVYINCMFDVHGWSLPWWAVMEWEMVE